MTPQERIAALELSNQRLRQALEYIREEYLFTAHGFHVASKALSSSEPSKVVEVLRQCEERRKNLLAALQYIARPDKDAMQRVWMAREALAKDAEEDKE